MNKETLKNLIELIPDSDVETIYNVVIKFVPESAPYLDEIEGIRAAHESILRDGTVSHEDINWD